jgi:hypothetical protein
MATGELGNDAKSPIRSPTSFATDLFANDKSAYVREFAVRKDGSAGDQGLASAMAAEVEA